MRVPSEVSHPGVLSSSARTKTTAGFLGAAQLSHRDPLQHVDSGRSVVDADAVLQSIEGREQTIITLLSSIDFGRLKLHFRVVRLERQSAMIGCQRFIGLCRLLSNNLLAVPRPRPNRAWTPTPTSCARQLPGSDQVPGTCAPAAEQILGRPHSVELLAPCARSQVSFSSRFQYDSASPQWARSSALETSGIGEKCFGDLPLAVMHRLESLPR